MTQPWSLILQGLQGGPGTRHTRGESHGPRVTSGPGAAEQEELLPLPPAPSRAPNPPRAPQSHISLQNASLWAAALGIHSPKSAPLQEFQGWGSLPPAQHWRFGEMSPQKRLSSPAQGSGGGPSPGSVQREWMRHWRFVDTGFKADLGGLSNHNNSMIP